MWNPCAELDALGERAQPSILDALRTRDGSIRMGALQYLSQRASQLHPLTVATLEQLEKSGDAAEGNLAAVALLRNGRITTSRLARALAAFAPLDPDPFSVLPTVDYAHSLSMLQILRARLPEVAPRLAEIGTANPGSREPLFVDLARVIHDFAGEVSGKGAAPQLSANAVADLMTVIEWGLSVAPDGPELAFRALGDLRGHSGAALRHRGLLGALIAAVRDSKGSDNALLARTLTVFAPDASLEADAAPILTDNAQLPTTRAEVLKWLLSFDRLSRETLASAEAAMRAMLAKNDPGAAQSWLWAIKDSETDSGMPLVAVVRQFYGRQSAGDFRELVLETVAHLRRNDIAAPAEVRRAIERQDADSLWAVIAITKAAPVYGALDGQLKKIVEAAPFGTFRDAAVLARAATVSGAARAGFVRLVLSKPEELQSGTNARLLCALLPVDPRAFVEVSGENPALVHAIAAAGQPCHPDGRTLTALLGDTPAHRGALVWLNELVAQTAVQPALRDLSRQTVEELPAAASLIRASLDDADPVVRAMGLAVLPWAKVQPFPADRVRTIARTLTESQEARRNAYLALALGGALSDEDAIAFQRTAQSFELGWDVDYWKRVAAHAHETSGMLETDLSNLAPVVPPHEWCDANFGLRKATIKQLGPDPRSWTSAIGVLTTASRSCDAEAQKTIWAEIASALSKVEVSADEDASLILGTLGAPPVEAMAPFATFLVERGFLAWRNGREYVGAMGSAAQSVLTEFLDENRPADPAAVSQIILTAGIVGAGPKWIAAFCRELKGGVTPYVPEAAAVVLGAIHGEGAEQAANCLEEVFRDKSRPAGVRLEALRAIGELGVGAEDRWRLLADSLSDADPFVRRYAAYGIRRLNAPVEVIPLLRAALHNEDVDVQSGAIAALGSFGPLAQSALEEIQAAAADPRTAPFARCALAKIIESWRKSSDASIWADMGKITSSPRLLPDIPKPPDPGLTLSLPKEASKNVLNAYDWLQRMLNQQGYRQLAHYLVDDGKGGKLRGVAVITLGENIDESGEKLPGAKRFSTAVQPLGSIDSRSFSSAVLSFLGEFVNRLENKYADKRLLLFVISPGGFEFPDREVRESELFRIQFAGAQVLNDKFRAVLSPVDGQVNCQAWAYEFAPGPKLVAGLGTLAHLCKAGFTTCPE